jgi:membrane-associated phospholipid phosphatase
MKYLLYPLIVFTIALQNTPALCQKTYSGITYLHKLQAKRTPGKTSFYKFISGSASPVSIGTPFAYWVSGMITKNNILKKDALFALESFTCNTAITYVTKLIVNKPRPHQFDSTIIALNVASNYSFPSGHTSEAFATATSLTLITHKWYVAVPAYAWAGLVGYSRLYLGVHYPIDVFAGALVGTGSAFLSYKLNKWMHHHKKKNKKAE